MLLKIENLKIKGEGKEILKGVNFNINSGEVQALLGPNASGKSTLAQVISGNPNYKITMGNIFFEGKDITNLQVEERVKLGIALTWQNPPTIKGVRLSQLLEKISKRNLVSEKNTTSFSEQTNEMKNEKLCVGHNLLEREINLDFSGGEKKISELIQIISLKPKLVIFDEIDSGLDIKKLEKVAEIIKKEFVDKNVSVLLITHSGEILNFLNPSFVNVMVDGKIICKEKNYEKVLKTIKEYDYEKCRKCELHAE